MEEIELLNLCRGRKCCPTVKLVELGDRKRVWIGEDPLTAVFTLEQFGDLVSAAKNGDFDEYLQP